MKAEDNRTRRRNTLRVVFLLINEVHCEKKLHSDFTHLYHTYQIFFRFLSEMRKRVSRIEDEDFLEDFVTRTSGLHSLVAVPVVIFSITNEQDKFKQQFKY